MHIRNKKDLNPSLQKSLNNNALYSPQNIDEKDKDKLGSEFITLFVNLSEISNAN